MGHVWKTTGDGQRYIGVLDKHDWALLLAGRPPVDRGTNTYADMATVISLRNWLVHSRPEYFSPDEQHKLGKRLTGKFHANALMASAGNPCFPDHALGAGCAEWAYWSAVAYVDHFASELNLKLNYQMADFTNEPPEVI